MRYTILLLLLAVGCTSPVTMRVIDNESEQPIVGAKVQFMHIKKPYLITGAAFIDNSVTDDDGYVTLADDVGGIKVNADGYQPVSLNGYYGKWFWLRLSRQPNGGQTDASTTRPRVARSGKL